MEIISLGSIKLRKICPKIKIWKSGIIPSQSSVWRVCTVLSPPDPEVVPDFVEGLHPRLLEHCQFVVLPGLKPYGFSQ